MGSLNVIDHVRWCESSSCFPSWLGGISQTETCRH